VVIDPKWYATNFDAANGAFTALQSG
jgi:hypothetical protein